MSLAGDLDLVVGSSAGELNYFENTGNSTAPVFVQRTGSANPFDGTVIGSAPGGSCTSTCSASAPALGDLDNDGMLIQCPSID